MSFPAVRTGRVRERVLTMRGISKRFGAVRALTDVDFWVNEGEVVALIGDNGAGKSTLVKVLAGVHEPDSGTIEYDGELVSIGTPADSQQLGIATVFQDLALCDNLDVVANLWLGRELRAGRTLDEVDMEQQTWTLLRELSAKIPSVRVPVASLSGGQRQTVAIARSLIGDPRVVILDEPTAALGVAQTAEVLNLIERLRERGHGVVLISHSMADVMAVADRAVVLRLGRNNGEYNIAEITSATLIAAITGAIDNEVTRRASDNAANA
jgi:ABC-type sugar transport system ATPase subunit